MSAGESPSRPPLEAFCHHRWALPAVAALHTRGGGAKFVTLQKALGVGRESLKRTLEGLMEAGLVMRNPGYGHPMRPEYILTARGRSLGGPCGRLWERIASRGLTEVCLRKWSLPGILALSRVEGRFNRLRHALPGATPRALATALRDLQEAGLAERYVVDDDPPRTEYQLTRGGRLLAPLIADLERHLGPS
jgi:DNA-binding HxlR family transcriptional regulator